MIVLGISIILLNSRPIIEDATTAVSLKNAENIMQSIDNAIMEVASEGSNSSRIITFFAPGEFISVPLENGIEFKKKIVSDSGADYFSRSVRNNVVFVGGNDVFCNEIDANNDGNTDLVAENSFLRVVFRKVAKTNPLQTLDTSYNIIQAVEKTGNTTVNFVNSSVVIDNNLSTYRGNGFSEILRTGEALPVCTIRFFVNSTVQYDIIYKLYTGADFFVAEVRNIR